MSLDWTDITSSHPPDEIDATPGNANNFTATLHNTSVNGAGGFIAANNITAKFSVANFGLPSNWTPILGSFAAQTQAPSTIPAATMSGSNINPGTASITSTPDWHITNASDINNYKTHADQCILVDLDSTAPDCIGSPNNCVSILNKSVKRNMWVLTASEVSKTAEISAKGYGPPPAGKTEHEFELHVTSHQQVLKPGVPVLSAQINRQQAGAYSGGKKDRTVSRLTWVVDGCRVHHDQPNDL